jgi:hypothetical protein
MPVVSWIMIRVRIWKNSELSVDFHGCCEWLITKQSWWIQSCSQAAWVHRSEVGGVVETGVWTADKQPVALLAKQ